MKNSDLLIAVNTVWVVVAVPIRVPSGAQSLTVLAVFVEAA